MAKKITSTFILIILMMNVCFEMFVSHHVHAQSANNSSEQVSFDLDHSADSSHQTQSSDDHCASGACHSGFCKLLNMNNVVHVTVYEQTMAYEIKSQLFPESPFLFSNRRPPKALV
ncbi:MAG: hypothetical protein ABL930_03160 [Pseudobdellovibrio sp.]